MNKIVLAVLLLAGHVVFLFSLDLRAATNNELEGCNIAARFLLFSCKPDLQDILDKPVYEDPAGINKLTGSAFGAFGRHPVKAITIDNPGYNDEVVNPHREYNGYFFVPDASVRLQVTLLYPSDMCTPRPTVFFMAG